MQIMSLERIFTLYNDVNWVESKVGYGKIGTLAKGVISLLESPLEENNTICDEDEDCDNSDWFPFKMLIVD